jgi:sulfoxide reductase heme-binding subunit YedZ
MGRWLHHLILAGLSLCPLAVAAVGGPVDQVLDRLSITSAYLFLALLCAGLSVGPLRALKSGRPTLNSHLRRDIGIWAALAGLLHLYLAMVASMTPEYMALFVDIANPAPSAAVRRELYSWSVIAGLVVGVLLLVLLTLSNDKSLRLLGSRWWKRLHRSSYIAFVLTVLHGFAFQVLESRTWSLILLLAAATLGIMVLQVRGARAVKKASNAKPE